MKTSLYSLLCCPECKEDLVLQRSYFQCKNCKNKYNIENGIPNFSVAIDEESMQLSQKKWDEKYKDDSKKNIVKELDFLEKKFFKLTWDQIQILRQLKKGELFLEIGCGTSFMGRKLAKTGHTIVGIDMSMEALKLAKSVFDSEGITNYLLVCGNVLTMPFKNNLFDLIYGAGVIEHFKDTGQAVSELARITKKGGVAYNTVPYLNVGTLTYRQVWGNIPRFPLLEPLFYIFHSKILGAKHMRFGYELSFTRNYLEKIHRKCGFSSAASGQFMCELDFDYIPVKSIKKFAKHLATNSPLFWPMIYVAGKK